MTQSASPPNDAFPPTHWSMVAQARDYASPHHGQAWTELFESYWTPIFCYIRRQGISKADAEDLAQAFFARLVKRGPLSMADQSRGRLRSYLMTTLKHFLIDQYRRQTSLKRGGKDSTLSLDANSEEPLIESVPSSEAAPDTEFDRQWALLLIESTLSSVEAEYEESGKSDLFSALKPHVSCGTERQPFAVIAEKLGMKSGTVRIAAYRLRKRFAAVMRSKISETVFGNDEAQDELTYLLNVFSSVPSR